LLPDRGRRSRGALFRVQLPSLGLDWAVMADIGNAELAVGPGHYPGTEEKRLIVRAKLVG
jgi:sortase (surface protein transpeptidase)